MKKLIILLIIVIILLIGGIFLLVDMGNEELIGGCADANELQECCDRWLEENDRVKPACVGEWVIKDGECAWECTSQE
ncbi:MAG: hypothetical protein ACP5D2_05270 [Candidatus Nanoarchaeia archaeon]